MVNYTFNTLCRYFTHLCNTGYMKQDEVNKLLLLTTIRRFVDCDFRGLLDEDRYNKINKALYKLYGTSCLIPYPDFYNRKNKRVMYTCSISELANRVENLEKNGTGSGGGTGGNVDLTPINNRITEINRELERINNKEIIIPTPNGEEQETDDIGWVAPQQ